MPYIELNCLTITILSSWTVQLKITKFPRNKDWMYSYKINGFITLSWLPLSLLLWITSGRLDRSVYKQGQVVCPTVECTVEKGEDGSLMANLKLEFPALTDEYEYESYSMGIFDNKWWLFEDSTYVNMLIVNFFGNISNELWVINVFVLTSAGVFM